MPEAASGVIRLLLVDDHLLLREGLQRFLTVQPGLHVAGACSSVQEALFFVQNQAVDLVLLDIGLGSGNGGEFLVHAASVGFQGRES